MTKEEWLEEFFRIVDNRRLEKGKVLFRAGKITDFESKAGGGGFIAKVQGSRSRPYNIDACFPVMEKGLPDLEEMVLDCSCPDWVEFCKHAVCAVMYYCREHSDTQQAFAEIAVHSADGSGKEIKHAITKEMVSLTNLEPPPFLEDDKVLHDIHRVVQDKLRDKRVE